MKSINVSEWHDFKISDIFMTIEDKGIQVPTGASLKRSELEDGDIPRISVTNFDNGVAGYYAEISNNPNYRVYENFISVSFLGTIFYQPEKASLDMKVHCLKPKNHELNTMSGLFLCSALMAMIQNISYADQISSKVLPKMIIKLPYTVSDGDIIPGWGYMESYMTEIEQVAQQNVDKNLEKIARYAEIE
jgi:hypothetical protein